MADPVNIQTFPNIEHTGHNHQKRCGPVCKMHKSAHLKTETFASQVKAFFPQLSYLLEGREL